MEDIRETSYQIVKVSGHYEAYIDGRFYCSADTFSEALKEVEKELGVGSL